MVRYHGPVKDGLIIGTNQYGKRVIFADNWPDRAHKWLPSQDHPSDKATVDFHVEVPPGMKSSLTECWWALTRCRGPERVEFQHEATHTGIRNGRRRRSACDHDGAGWRMPRPAAFPSR